jgi:homoserine dehydrogenase
MKTVNIGIIGLGTVGSGVVDAINRNGSLIAERTGVSLVVKGVCDKDKKALEKADCKASSIKTSSYKELINDKGIDVIVELVGGIEPAKSIILDALDSGKHVVTANKALLSESWKEIFKAASEKGLFVNFEASVGGAIPIIRTLRESFVANKINTIYGILNGTTNFILTMMEEKGLSFDEALKIAQEKGIAEKDPALDISGADSAHKLAILSLLCFGQEVYAKDVYTEGICSIGPKDIANAKRLGYSVKLLGIAKDSGSGLELRVHPTLLRSSHLLSDVRGADNAIYVKGDLIGESLLFGKGAGKAPTSSSIVSDIVEIAEHVAYSGSDNPLPYRMNYASCGKGINRMEDMYLAYYLRFSVIDKPGVLAGISTVLSENNISIANVSQEERNEGETVPVVILTHKAKEGDMCSAIAKIDAMDYVTSKTVVIRIEG